MSFLHCACTKARVGDSPVTAPFDRDQNTAVPDDSRTEASSESNADMIEYEANPVHYQLYSIIGKGCTEDVTIYIGKHLPSGSTVAIKKTNLETTDIDIKVIQKEIILSRQLQHDKILPLYSSFTFSRELSTVMPLMAYGSCKDLIHAFFTNGLPEQAITYILRDVLKALEYLHNQAFIHRGIKASHILLSASGKVALTGLRNAYCMIRDGQRRTNVHEYPANGVKSLLWLCPEILEQNIAGYDVKADIYSLGITACELANGCVPFADMPVTQMLLEKLNGTKPVLMDSRTMKELASDSNTSCAQGNSVNVSPALNKSSSTYQRLFSQHFHNLTDFCLEKDPNKRPSATALLNHPFFRNIRRHTSDALPGLLQPVTPLSDLGKLPKDDSTSNDLAQKVQDISIEDRWLF